MQKGSLTRTLFGASYLLVLIGLLTFLYFDTANAAPKFFPQDTARWNQILGTYMIVFSLILVYGLIAARQVVQQLAQAPYWRSFALRFVPSGIVTFAVLLVFRALTLGPSAINPFDALQTVSASVLFFHLFVVSNIEEIGIRGIVFESIAKKNGIRNATIATTAIFAVFHYTASGGSLLVMATFIPLSLIWTYIKLKGYPLLNRNPTSRQFFGPTRYTQQANAGSHFAWNLFIITFVKPTGV